MDFLHSECITVLITLMIICLLFKTTWWDQFRLILLNLCTQTQKTLQYKINLNPLKLRKHPLHDHTIRTISIYVKYIITVEICIRHAKICKGNSSIITKTRVPVYWFIIELNHFKLELLCYHIIRLLPTIKKQLWKYFINSSNIRVIECSLIRVHSTNLLPYISP